MIDLSGRHVMVVGGSRGIGAATAVMAARAGADVSIVYRVNSSAATQVASQINHQGRRAVIVAGDASVDGVVDGALDQTVEQLGPLSGMVVSAGIFEAAKIDEMAAEFWDRTLTANLRSTFLAVRAAARQMRANNVSAGQPVGGSIVIYTSTAGQRGSAGYSAYAASKAGQIIFMRSMAQELGADGVRVNCIAPAWTETDMAAPSLDALGREEVARSFLLGRIGLPSDVAGATMFLLSDLAAFITGSTLTVDGGKDLRG